MRWHKPSGYTATSECWATPPGIGVTAVCDVVTALEAGADMGPHVVWMSWVTLSLAHVPALALWWLSWCTLRGALAIH